MEPIACRCVSCGHLMQFPPGEAGRPFQCPRCRFAGKVPVPLSGAVRPKPTDEDADAAFPTRALGESTSSAVPEGASSAARTDPPEDWRPVRTGLRLAHAAAFLHAAAVILSVLAFGFLGLVVVYRESVPFEDRLGLAADPSAGRVAGGVFLCLSLALLTQEVLALVGQGLCVAVPARTGARMGAVLSVALGVSALAAGVAAALSSSWPAPSPELARLFASGWPVLVAVLLVFSRKLTFLLFLRRLAAEFRDTGLAHEVRGLLVLEGLTLLAMLAGPCLTAFGLGSIVGELRAALALAFLAGVLWIVFLLGYRRVLRDAGRLIDRQTAA